MKGSFRKWLTLGVLCMAGGVIYQLPYIREAYYVPLLEALDINNEQIGILMSAYGIGNLLLYLPGGVLADRISAKILVPVSLIFTGLTGYYYATFPSFAMVIVIHVIFAFTTVLTFWPTVVKVVKLLGDSSEQGKLFGLLEGGRGLTATVAALLSVVLFKKLGEHAFGLQGVMIFYSTLLIVLGVISYFLIENVKEEAINTEPIMKGMLTVLKMPSIWLASIILFTAYSINGGLTYLTPYMTDVLNMSVSLGATMGIIRTYGVRIGGGPLGGILADRMGSATKFLTIGYALLIILTGMLIVIPTGSALLWISLTNILLVSVVIATMRGVYYVPIDEMKIPDHYVGVAAGAIFLVGYLPDTFIYIYYGSLLDRFPGVEGYRYLFMSIIGLAIIGLISSVILYRQIKRIQQA